MGIFDRFKGQSGNQTEEEQQDVSQPTGGQFSDQPGQGGMQTAQNTIGQQGGPQDSGMGDYQDPNQSGYQDPTQGGGSLGQNQGQGDYQDPNQSGYQEQTQPVTRTRTRARIRARATRAVTTPTRISTGTRTRASKPASPT